MKLPASLGIPLEAIAGIAVAAIAIIGIVAGVATTESANPSPTITPTSTAPTPTPTSTDPYDYKVIDQSGKEEDDLVVTYPASYTGCSNPVQHITETDTTVTIRWGYVFYESDSMCSMEMTEYIASATLKQPLGDRKLDIIFDPDYFYN